MFVLVIIFEFNDKQGQIVDSYTDTEVSALKRDKLWDFPSTEDQPDDGFDMAFEEPDQQVNQYFRDMRFPTDSEEETETEDEDQDEHRDDEVIPPSE